MEQTQLPRISQNSIEVLLQLIPLTNPMNTPNPVGTAQLLVTAQQELAVYKMALTNPIEVAPDAPTPEPSVDQPEPEIASE